MGRITSFSKQVIKFLICFSLIYTPTLLFAGAAESWTVEKVVYDNVGKNLSYTASRVNALASNDLVYKAKVPVTAAATGSTVANMIRLGLAGAAIYGLVQGVGWVIDNGVVKKKVEKEEDLIKGPYVWKGGRFTSYDATSVCKLLFPDTTSTGSGGVPLFISTEFVSPDSANCVYRQYGSQMNNQPVYRTNNPNYDPAYKPSYIPVPHTELGDLIIDSPVAPQLIPDIYNPNNPARGAAPEATKRALDSANPQPRQKPKSDTEKKPNKDTDGDGQPDVYDPALPDIGETTEWPEACSWFPTICEWYTKYKEDSDLVKEHREAEKDIWLKEDVAREEEKTAREEEKEQRKDEKTFWQKVEDWFNWTKDDLPEYPDSQLDIPDPTSPDINTDISFGGSCPASRSVPVSFAGISTEIEFSFQWFCEIASIAKPVIISISAFAAALIVAGVRTEDD